MTQKICDENRTVIVIFEQNCTYISICCAMFTKENDTVKDELICILVPYCDISIYVSSLFLSFEDLPKKVINNKKLWVKYQ